MPYDKILNGENLLKKSKVFIGIACNAEKFAIVFFVVFSPSFFPTCQFFGNILLKAFLRQFFIICYPGGVWPRSNLLPWIDYNPCALAYSQ